MPVPAVVLATLAMPAVHEIVVVRERSVWKILFNVSQSALSYGLAAVVFRALAQVTDATIDLSTIAGVADTFFPFYGLAVTFFGLNLLFVSVATALRDEERIRDVLTEAAGRGGGNLFYDLLASPIALGAAFLYQTLYVGGLLVVVLPLLLLRHSYLSAIQLEQANRDLLRVLVKAIETRDPYTSGHSLRVSTLAKAIARDYGVRPQEISSIENAALLHDIGKIEALYAEIISKSSSLSEEERDVIRTHATRGADLLQSLTSLDVGVIKGVRHHHERYDGKGYPEGLSGKSIPLAARIIMICDAIDAMLSDRPYREALSIRHVKAELDRCSGTQFDPDIVRAILAHNTLERAELLVERAGARARSDQAEMVS
jgi:putative nucleotidyltransferase with HDIG domain